MINLRDIAGNAEEEEGEVKDMDSNSWRRKEFESSKGMVQQKWKSFDFMYWSYTMLTLVSFGIMDDHSCFCRGVSSLTLV